MNEEKCSSIVVDVIGFRNIGDSLIAIECIRKDRGERIIFETEDFTDQDADDIRWMLSEAKRGLLDREHGSTYLSIGDYRFLGRIAKY
jgi:hypothetical protein